MDKDPYITEGTYSKGNLGPYEFDTWERNSRMAFTRNDDYYRREKIGEVNGVDYSKSPYWDTLTYQQFDESSTALSALQTGEVDLAGVPDQKVSNFRGNDSTQLYESPFDNGVFWLNLNHRANGWAPIRDSREVRYAIGNAFDPDTVIEEAYNGLAVPLRTFHPSWGPYYPPEDKLTSLPGDLEKAREQLKSGTSDDYYYEGDKFMGPDGQVELSMVRTTGNPSVEISTNYLQQRLEKLGITSTIEAKQWSTLLADYAMNSADNVEDVDEPDFSIGAFNGGPWDQSVSSEQWDIMVGLGFSTSPYAPWSAVKSTLDVEGTFNLWGYHQDEYDVSEFIGRASTAESQEQVQSMMTEIFSFISEDMPFIFTSSGYNVTGLANDIVGLPGEETDDGYKSNSYWQDVNEAQPERLYARNTE
jgi:peptide/nickel transport system substrate-binding protein